MATPSFANVLVEPHQKHVTGQSDLETALHILLDHLREPFLAVKGSATEFSHTFNRSFHLGAHKPKNVNGGYARVFAPRIDMRESTQAYYIDLELPGVHDKSNLNIVWRSDRELLVEGVLERPIINDVLGFDAQSHQRDAGSNGFEKHNELAPQSLWASPAEGDVDPADVQRRLREQANPFVPPAVFRPDEPSDDARVDPFPIDIVNGTQLDADDNHRVQVPLHHLPHGDYVDGSRASVSIGERGVGRFMRCFVFPHSVDVRRMRSQVVDGLLRIGVPKDDHDGGGVVE